MWRKPRKSKRRQSIKNSSDFRSKKVRESSRKSSRTSERLRSRDWKTRQETRSTKKRLG